MKYTVHLCEINLKGIQFKIYGFSRNSRWFLHKKRTSQDFSKYKGLRVIRK